MELANEGDAQAEDRLFRLVYDELHGMAKREMRAQRLDHTLQATALVNEAYLRVFGREWKDRKHFLSVAARAMRSVLVDHARRRSTSKRTPPEKRIPLEHLTEAYEERSHDLVALDEALGRLAEVDERMVRLTELRFFAGRSMEEAAEVVGLPLRSAQREWATARAWLRKEIE